MEDQSEISDTKDADVVGQNLIVLLFYSSHENA
jgi:hypothetical protein